MRANRSKNLVSYIIPAILFPMLSLLVIFEMIDTDLWFHMKAGQVITETGRFIYRDIFSYTADGREWLYHEWLFGVLSFKVYALFGVNGLIFGKATILILAFILIYRDMRLRGVNPYLASIVLFIAVLAARFRFTERPHIFKFLFVVLFIYILDLYRLKGKNRLWLLPFVQILWVNIHGSFILSPVIISIYLISEAISGKRQNFRRLSTTLFLTALTTLINPYGIKLILFSLGFGEKAVLSSLTEWAPTTIKDFYGAFGFLFILGVASFILKYRDIEIVDILLFGLFSYLSIRAIRFTALFPLATAPITAFNLSYIILNLFPSSTKNLTVKIFVKIFIAASSIAIIAMFSTYEFKRNSALAFGIGQGEAFPERAFEFVKQQKIEGNMYNSYIFGGYLIWKGFPERKVFVDGRAEVYSKEFQDAFISGSSMSKWTQAISRYDINYAVIAYSKEGFDPIGKQIAIDPKWVLIYWDDAARVYVRDVPRNQSIIDSYGHRVMVNPITFTYNALKEAINKGLGERLEIEFKRDIESGPDNSKALYLLGMLYYETERKGEAVTAWEESVRIMPDANTYSSIGNVFSEKKAYTKAIEYYKKAIETDKSFVEAYYNLGDVYDSVGNKREAVRAYNKFMKYAGPEYAETIKELKERGIE